MATNYDRARKELDEILAGIMTEKRMRESDKYIIGHDLAMKELGNKRRNNPEWQVKMGTIVSNAWADENKKTEHKKALKEAWNKPGARENKSRSVNEVLSRPGMLEAHQERARKNGRKNMRPCRSPEGIFESNRAWAEKTGYSRDLFGYRARKMPDQYCYITQEEYIRLTGKDPFNG